MLNTKFSLTSVISYVPNKIKSLRQKNLARKIEYLRQKTFWHYYMLLAPKEPCADVDFLPFVYEMQRTQRAQKETEKQIERIVKDGLVNECYRLKIKDEKAKRV